MRPWALALLSIAFLTVPPSAIAQEPLRLPRDGNGLLEYCNQILVAFDSPTTEVPIDLQVVEDMSKALWCGGYLEGTRDVTDHLLMNLAIGMAAVGPEKGRELAVGRTLVCMPDGVPTAQLARVMVKWLRDHPERLHEPRNTLTLDALQDSFPCQRDAQKEENGQQR